MNDQQSTAPDTGYRVRDVNGRVFEIAATPVSGGRVVVGGDGCPPFVFERSAAHTLALRILMVLEGISREVSPR